MITKFGQFLLEKKNSKALHADLIIVDVQESFSKFITDEYVRALYDYCKLFDRVYQVWDSIDQDKPTYNFPRQAYTVEKQYGFDLDTNNLSDYFMPHVATRILRLLDDGFQQGDSFETKYGDLLVHVGAAHEWFLVPQELKELFRKMKVSGRPVYMAGGADNECLTDVFVAAKACGVNIYLSREYVYSAKHCPEFPDFSDEVLAQEEQKAQNKKK